MIRRTSFDGIIGMHLFTGRNLVIDANPAASQAASGRGLYISDPVTPDAYLDIPDRADVIGNAEQLDGAGRAERDVGCRT